MEEEIINALRIMSKKQLTIYLQGKKNIPSHLLLKILREHNYSYYDIKNDITVLPKVYRKDMTIATNAVLLNPVNYSKLSVTLMMDRNIIEIIKKNNIMYMTYRITFLSYITVLLVILLSTIWYIIR